MSDNQITLGYMAELTQPVGDSSTEAWEAMQERLQATTNLQLNYDGTIVFSKIVQDVAYNFDLKLLQQGAGTEFIKDCATAVLSIDAGGMRPFFSHWYNGADSPMSTITLAEFHAAE